MPNTPDYFADRINQELDKEAVHGYSSKYDSIQAASDEKIAKLTNIINKRKLIDELNASSLVAKLGLDADSNTGAAVNLLASSVAGITDPLGGNLDKYVAADVFTGEKTSSIQRRVGDVGVSALKSAIAVPEMAVGLASMVTGGHAGKILEEAGFRPEEAKAFLDTLYSHEQQAANANVHGAEGFWNTMAQIAENPSTVPHALIESLFPMLAGGVAGRGLQALGMASKGATAAGEGLVMAGSQAESIRNQTEDGLLTPKQAFLAAMTAPMGAAVARVGMKGSEKLGLGDIDEAIVKGTFGKSKHGAAVNTVGSGAMEAAEEGLQSSGETILQNAALDRPLTEGMGNAAAIGMVTGAAMGAPMGLAQVEGGKAAIARKAAIEQEAIKAAIQTNDTKTFLDPKSENYSPATAVSVLLGNTDLPDTAPEAKAANLDQATKIVSDLDAEIQTGWNEYFKLEEAGTDKTELKSMELGLVMKERGLAEARKIKDNLATKITSVAEVKTLVAEANKPAAEADITKVEQVINLSMKSPAMVSQEEAEELANNTNNSLTTAQRDYFRSFSESRIAQNLLQTTDGVSKDIFDGSATSTGRKNIGIKQRIANVSEAISMSNPKRAKEEVAGITKFAESHSEKAAAVTEAWSMYQDKGTVSQVIMQGGKWQVVPDGTVTTQKELTAMGGLTIYGASSKIAAAVPVEAAALKATAAALQKAVEITFNPKPVTASATPAAQAAASPTPAASVPSAATQQTTDTAPAVAATAETAKAVEGVAESKNNTKPVVESKTQDQAPQKEIVASEEKRVDSAPSTEVTSPAPLKDRTDENSGSTVRPSETLEDTTQEVTEEVTTTSGLNVLAQKSVENTPYQKRNLLADYLTQTVHREGDATKRPLVAVKNFLSKWLGKETSFRDYLTEPKGGYNDKHFTVLRLFQKKASEWDNTIKSNLFKRAGQEDYWFKDLMQFVLQGQGKDLDIEENIKTGMSFAGFSWIAENAARGAYNTPEEINLILGREEDHKVSDTELARLADVGTRQNVVVNALGQRVIQSLGLKASKNAPADLMPRLESALGAHVMKLLLDQGILVRRTISGAEMAELMGKAASPEEAKANHQFISLARDKEGNLNQQADEIVQANKGTQGVLEKLFGVEAGLKYPSFDPIPFIQKKTKNTNQDIPEVLAKVMEHENSVANYVRDDTMQLVGQLSKEVFLAMAGAEVITEDTHITNRKSIQAKNDALEREYDRFMEFYESMDDKSAALYLEHSVWMQQRVGVATNAINPQSSKIHRHLLYRKSWETVIDLADEAQMQNFRLRVAEGLGIKTDKQGSDKALAKYQETIQNPIIKKAITILRKSIFEGGTTADEQQALLAAVNEAGEAMHSLDALIALARYAEAKAKGDTSFTVQMMGEVDGVTNGPMLSHLLLGAAPDVTSLFELLNKGGFYQVGNQNTQYNLWRGVAGHLDLYEQTALHITQAVQGMLVKEPRMAGTLTAIYAFTGELASAGTVTKDGRNIVKTPLTAMVFGSSLKSSVDSMADKFIESIYSKIEKIETEDQRKAIVKHLATLGVRLPTHTSKQELLELEFRGSQLKSLQSSFKESLGKAVEETMKYDFEAFIRQRKQFNLAAQMTFEIYNAAYTGMREAYVQELISTKEIPVDGVGKPMHELTSAQEATLRKRLEKLVPVMHSAMSKTSGSLKAGLYMGKSTRKLSQSKTYAGEIKFGAPFKDNNAKSTETHAYETVAINPGVAMLPVSTHSFDSSVMHTSIGNTEVLNVHDAKGVGLKGFKQAAQSLNQSVWDGMLTYSPASEVFDALTRTLKGLDALVQEGNLPPAVLDNLAGAMKALAAKQEMSIGEVLPEMVFSTKEMAFLADDMKLQALSQMASIDQYALEGGNHTVTDKDRQQAADMRAELTREVTPELRQMVERLNALIVNKVPTAKVESKPDQELDALPVKAKSKTSPFGKLGQSAIASDPELVFLFEKNPSMSARDVLKVLIKKLKDGGKHDQFQTQLAAQLYRTLGTSDLTVNYVTPDTKEGDVINTGAKGAMGWYTSNSKGEHAIYVLSPDFVASGLTAEVLLHEITHGVLARTIATEMNAKDPDSNAYKLIQDLEALRAKAVEFVGKDTKHAEALVDIQEFVAWGMTNKAFQNEVLSKITMQSKTKKNELITGMKQFIKDIVGIVFGGMDKSHQAVAVNGLTILIGNVSGLLNQAQQNSAPKDLTLNQIGTTTYTTQTLFEGLDSGNTDQAHSNHLQNLLGTIVEKLHGPFGSFKEQFMTGAVGTSVDIFAKAIATGVAPFASKVQAAGMKLSEQELFVIEQVEATIQTALDDKIATSRAAYRELAKLYQETKEKFTPADFTDPADYDFIFKIEAVNGKTDHLARFAAMGLAHQEFNRMLKVPTKLRINHKAKTFSEWLQEVFDNILEMFNQRVTATYEGQRADTKLENLVGQLVDIEAKRVASLQRKQSRINYAGIADNKLAEGIQEITNKLEKLGRSSWFKNHKNDFVKAAGSLSSMVLGGRQQLFMQAISDMRDRMNAGAPGLAAGLFNELRDPTQILHELLRASKHRDKHTVHVKNETAKFALRGFANEGNDLSKEQTEGITSVILRTGAHNLLGKFSMQQLANMLADPTALNKAIDDAVIELGKFPKYRHYYVYQAKVLGYFLATEKTKGELLVQNAGNIARLSGTPYTGRVTEADATAATEILNVLVTLYGLQYSEPNEVTQALAVLRKENGRTDGNGIESLMLLHKDLEKEAREKTFAGNESLMVHGYTAEIYNPHIDVVVADVATEGKDLIDQGWVQGGLVSQDPADPDQSQKAIYVMRDAGAQPLVTGSMAYQDRSAKGTGKHTGNLNQNTMAGVNNSLMVQNMAAQKVNKIRDMFKPNPSFNPALVKGNRASPVMNAKGEITNWRYLMQKRTKNNILERDNRFDQVLGQVAGSIYDKATVTDNNTNVVNGLHEIYKKEFALNADRFINVGPNSSDAEMREIFRLLPKATREVVEQVWGRDGMMVRKDSLDIVFGYHKLSMSTMFDKLESERSYFEHAFTFMIEHALEVYVMGENQIRKSKGLQPYDPKKYVRRASMLIRKSERIWQAIVQEMKDIIVVKTGTVMIGNVLSNFMLLKMSGVPLGDMVRNSLIAARAAREYQRDEKELFDLETKLSLGLGNTAQIEQEIARLNDAIARNPVRELIDAGLMPTIAEDVESAEDPYSYKSALTHKMEKFATKVNPKVLEVGKFVYMSRDTKMYKALAETTQLSDFVARYAYVQHLTNRKDNPLSKEAAIQEASDAFINYDIPMHRKMTYSDDMGFTLFSKYFLRVQRVLMKLFKEHPGNVMATMLMTNYVIDIPTALESSVFERLGNNPLRAGMLAYPSALDELATVNATVSLMK